MTELGFAEILHDGPVLLELVQPQERGPETDHHLDELAEALERAPIDAINIPEIVDEDVDEQGQVEPLGPRCPPDRLDIVDYAEVLHEEIDASVLANHVAALREPGTLETWLGRAEAGPGVEGVVLVGGSSSDRTYPGPGVPEANAVARKTLGEDGPVVGNICIQGRRSGGLDEPERMVRKIQAGCDFFTSQIIYDAEPVVDLLADYEEACREANVAPRPVLLTVAPLDRRADVEFLRSLRVTVPDDVEAHLFEGDPDRATVRDRAVSVVEAQWGDIQSTLRDRDIRVPTGLNVAHVRWHNLAAAVELAWRLPTIWPPQRGLDAPEIRPLAPDGARAPPTA